MPNLPGSTRSEPSRGTGLARPQRRRGDAFRPLSSARDAPVRIFGFGRQPAKEIMVLVGPIGVAVEGAAGARLDVKASTKSEAGQAARAADSRRIFRQRVLMRTDLQAQASCVAIHADVRLRDADQCDA